MCLAARSPFPKECCNFISMVPARLAKAQSRPQDEVQHALCHARFSSHNDTPLSFLIRAIRLPTPAAE